MRFLALQLNSSRQYSTSLRLSFLLFEIRGGTRWSHKSNCRNLWFSLWCPSFSSLNWSGRPERSLRAPFPFRCNTCTGTAFWFCCKVSRWGFWWKFQMRIRRRSRQGASGGIIYCIVPCASPLSMLPVCIYRTLTGTWGWRLMDTFSRFGHRGTCKWNIASESHSCWGQSWDLDSNQPEPKTRCVPIPLHHHRDPSSRQWMNPGWIRLFSAAFSCRCQTGSTVPVLPFRAWKGWA